MSQAPDCGPPFAISQRLSSKVAYEQRLATHKQSREDLKRKISDPSLIKNSIAYKKLRMSELEEDREELQLEKICLDMEKARGTLREKDYRKAHQKDNARIISTGDKLWDLTRRVREDESDPDQLRMITPDAEGAFVNTLLKLYIDPMVSRKRSSTAQSNMRRAAIERYGSLLDAPNGTLWCPINKQYVDAQGMRAAHIVPASIGPEVVDYIFGPGSGSRLFSADNCLMMHQWAERLFDRGCFVLIPTDSNESPIKRWTIKLVNNAAKDKSLADLGDAGKLSSLDNTELEFKNDSRPATRFLYYHLVVTLLRNRRNRQPGWEKSWTELKTRQPWATTGPYLRKSMLLALARQVDDVAESDIETLFADRGTFDGEGLIKREEDEVARRVLIAHGDGKGDGQDVVGEDIDEGDDSDNDDD